MASGLPRLSARAAHAPLASWFRARLYGKRAPSTRTTSLRRALFRAVHLPFCCGPPASPSAVSRVSSRDSSFCMSHSIRHVPTHACGGYGAEARTFCDSGTLAARAACVNSTW